MAAAKRKLENTTRGGDLQDSVDAAVVDAAKSSPAKSSPAKSSPAKMSLPKEAPPKAAPKQASTRLPRIKYVHKGLIFVNRKGDIGRMESILADGKTMNVRMFDDLNLKECAFENDNFAPRKNTIIMTINEIYKNRGGSVAVAERMKKVLPAKECKGLYYLNGAYLAAAKNENNWSAKMQ